LKVTAILSLFDTCRARKAQGERKIAPNLLRRDTARPLWAEPKAWAVRDAVEDVSLAARHAFSSIRERQVKPGSDGRVDNAT